MPRVRGLVELNSAKSEAAEVKMVLDAAILQLGGCW